MQKFLWFVVLCGVGSVVVMVPLALGGLEFLVHFGVSYTCRIVEGGMVWPQWQKIPIPVYLKIRLFNITNPKDFAFKGAKPIVQEVGPYVYREVIEKFDITKDEYADTLRYRQVRFYYFEPKMSRGKESDLVNIINVAFVGVAKLAHEFTDVDYLLETLDDMLVKKGEKLYRKHSVKEILFEGFQVKSFLELAKDPVVQSAGNISIPEKLMDGKLGILEGKNGSDEGWFEVRSGSRDPNDFGRVVTWNGMPSLTKWKGDPCNLVRGTDGILFQPFLKPSTILEAFVPDLCRSLTFKFAKVVDHNGINTYRFVQPESLYESSDKNPENWCYCSHENSSFCPPKGVISVATCFEGAPLAMSMPHFLYADESVQRLEGISPSEEKHLGYFDLHPMTGVSVEVKQRVQFAIELQPWEAMPTFNNVPRMFLPILWAEEGGDLDDLNKTLLKVLDFGLKLWGFGKWVAIVFWILVTSGAVALIIYNRKNSRVELIDEKEDDE